jgi:hypothetical protein
MTRECGRRAVIAAWAAAAAIVLEPSAFAESVATDGAAATASWTSPSDAEVRTRLERFLENVAPGPEARRKAVEAFTAAGAFDRLDRIVAALAVVDPRVAKLAGLEPPGAVAKEDIVWLLADSNAGPPDAFLRESVQLHVARHLVRCGLFDDAMPLLSSLDVRTSVDPATLLFAKASCQHWLLDVEPAIETLDRLLERGSELPVRYERLATLMRKDLDSLEDDSLDHIARRMRDITRRLSFGRAGPTTRSVQDGVIESLDKLIEKIEKQQSESQQQGGGGGGGSSGGGQGSKPMQDSMPAGGKGPGEVTKRDISDGEGWGNLPPHEREEALQQIGREFPTHYREAIEQYFKRLATGEQAQSPTKAKGP